MTLTFIQGKGTTSKLEPQRGVGYNNSLVPQVLPGS